MSSVTVRKTCFGLTLFISSQNSWRKPCRFQLERKETPSCFITILMYIHATGTGRKQRSSFCKIMREVLLSWHLCLLSENETIVQIKVVLYIVATFTIDYWQLQLQVLSCQNITSTFWHFNWMNFIKENEKGVMYTYFLNSYRVRVG